MHSAWLLSGLLHEMVFFGPRLNAHALLQLPVAHVMPMRDDARARFELAQQFWAQFQIESAREEEHDHRCLAHVGDKKVLVQKSDVMATPAARAFF